jgi:hypothetical protein
MNPWFFIPVLSCMLSAQAAPDPTLSLRDLLGIPYVNDGVQDEKGHWITFTHPEKPLKSPGFNCSGFALAAARRLMGYSGTLDQATRDRLGDSGKDSKLGLDWDFAWDLVMNLSEGRKRRVMLPEGEGSLEGANGLSLRGFPMEGTQAWKRVLPRIRSGCVYLCSLSRIAKSGHVQHYHAAVLVRDPHGCVWFYQTLPFGHSHRLNLSSGGGLARMQHMFGSGKRILVLEVEADPMMMGGYDRSSRP